MKFRHFLGVFMAFWLVGCTQPPITREDMLARSSYPELTAHFWDLARKEKLPKSYHGMSDQIIMFHDFKNEKFSSFEGKFSACCDVVAREFKEFARLQNLNVREFSPQINAKIATLALINRGDAKEQLKEGTDIALVAFDAANKPRAALVRVRHIGKSRGGYREFGEGETISSVIRFDPDLAQIYELR